MYSCPSCGRSDVENLDTCVCGADLTLLKSLDGVADGWFNRGLACLADGNEGRALEWLAACCAARPLDAPATLALAKVWARLGRWDEASSALARAADIDPTLGELEAVRQAIEDGLRSAAPSEKSGRAHGAQRVVAGSRKIARKVLKRGRKGRRK